MYDFFTVVKNEEHLDRLLKKAGLKKFVKSKCTFNELLAKFPIMEEFKIGNTFDSRLINEYIGEEVVPFQCILSSYTINIILNELDKRTLLKK